MPLHIVTLKVLLVFLTRSVVCLVFLTDELGAWSILRVGHGNFFDRVIGGTSSSVGARSHRTSVHLLTSLLLYKKSLCAECDRLSAAALAATFNKRLFGILVWKSQYIDRRIAPGTVNVLFQSINVRR